MISGPRWWLLAAVLLGAANPPPPAPARPQSERPRPARPIGWTTLGTAGGPQVQPDRSQPANLLETGGETEARFWLVDCGDGASERLAAAGTAPGAIDTVLLSHLHVDHVAGLLGLISLRWFTQAPHPLTIYGPAGTDKLVAGLIQALQPVQAIGIGVRGAAWSHAIADTVRVRILTDGSDVRIDGVRVRAVGNSHYADERGHLPANGSESLSYRFDLDGYAIGYTGDTGPSAAVAKLERGVDLLVSEVIDLEPILDEIKRRYPDFPPAAMQALSIHLRTQHLRPEQVGMLAAEVRPKRLVMTHLTAVGPTAGFAPRLIASVRHFYGGEIMIAHDMDRF